MKKKIFIKFFSVTLASVLLMFIFSIIAVDLNTKKIVSERLKQETELTATLLNDKSDFSQFEKYKGNREFRITILDIDGNVLYESDTSAELENHKDREEIKNALKGTPGTTQRYSDTFKCNMTYYATKASLSDGSDIIVRLAIKSSQMTQYIVSIIPLLILVLAVSIILSIALSSFLSWSISQKITDIGTSLKSVNDKNYSPIKTNTSEPELYFVLNEINSLNENIHEHIRIADRESAKLNTVLDNVSQSIIALDCNSRVAFANKSALKLFEGKPYDVGRDLVYLIEDLELKNKIEENQNKDIMFEYEYNSLELSVYMNKVTDSNITDSISAIIIITDITKEKLMEKQKSDFFANASHELKTPITVMQGFSEVLLAKENIDEASKKQLARICSECHRLSSLITDMLTLSKIESGEDNEIALSEVSLDHIVSDVFSELDEEIKKKHLSTKLCGSALIYSDSYHIYTLVENLISNAVKYNKEGGSVTANIKETEAGTVLEIKDTGIGIEKEHLPRLCERFYRVDKSHSKRIGGTGLGLSIVKHICALIGAEITIDSDFGIGTTVTVLFKKAQ